MRKYTRQTVAALAIAVALGGAGVDAAMAQTTNQKTKKVRIERVDKPLKHRQELKTKTRTVPGIVESISDTGLTMKKGKKTYTVTYSATAAFVDRDWKALAGGKGDIKVGDKVRIKGTLAGTDVSANTVRDISIPVVSTSTAM